MNVYIYISHIRTQSHSITYYKHKLFKTNNYKFLTFILYWNKMLEDIAHSNYLMVTATTYWIESWKWARSSSKAICGWQFLQTSIFHASSKFSSKLFQLFRVACTLSWWTSFHFHASSKIIFCFLQQLLIFIDDYHTFIMDMKQTRYLTVRIYGEATSTQYIHITRSY